MVALEDAVEVTSRDEGILFKLGAAFSWFECPFTCSGLDAAAIVCFIGAEEGLFVAALFPPPYVAPPVDCKFKNGC